MFERTSFIRQRVLKRSSFAASGKVPINLPLPDGWSRLCFAIVKDHVEACDPTSGLPPLYMANQIVLPLVVERQRGDKKDYSQMITLPSQNSNRLISRYRFFFWPLHRLDCHLSYVEPNTSSHGVVSLFGHLLFHVSNPRQRPKTSPVMDLCFRVYSSHSHFFTMNHSV